MDFRGNKQATARGLRINNPFNLKKTAIGWKGKVTPSLDSTFETFDTIENGIRAGIIDIVGDIAKDKKDTLVKLFHAYAPPFENDTTSYIAYVSKVTGIDQNAPLTVAGKVDAGTIAKLASAIIAREQGPAQAKLIPASVLSDAVYNALQSPNIKKYVSTPPGGFPSVNERLNDYSGLILIFIVLLLIISTL